MSSLEDAIKEQQTRMVEEDDRTFQPPPNEFSELRGLMQAFISFINFYLAKTAPPENLQGGLRASDWFGTQKG